MISVEFVNADRQRLETDIATLNFGLEDAQCGRREAEKRTDRLRLEVNRLRHDLRRELRRRRDNHHHAVRSVMSSQVQIRDQGSGPRDITTIQAKLTDIEAELAAAQRNEHDF